MHMLIALVAAAAPAFAAVTVEQGAGPADSAFMLIVGPGKHVKLISGVGGLKVMRDGKPVEDAQATVNGAALKKSMMGGLIVDKYNKAGVPGIGAGKALDISVKAGGETVKLSVPCPADVEVTSPAEGSAVPAGGKVKVAWKGELGAPDQEAKVNGIVVDPKTLEEKPGASKRPVKASGVQQAEIEVPSGNQPAIRFHRPGVLTSGVRCSLVKRVGLKK